MLFSEYCISVSYSTCGLFPFWPPTYHTICLGSLLHHSITFRYPQSRCSDQTNTFSFWKDERALHQIQNHHSHIHRSHSHPRKRAWGYRINDPPHPQYRVGECHSLWVPCPWFQWWFVRRGVLLRLYRLPVPIRLWRLRGFWGRPTIILYMT